MIIIINIFPMTFPKHVIQSCAGQEEIHPFTLALALPYTTHLTTGPKFSSVSKWQYHNHTAPLYSLNSSWGCKTYNCLSSRRNAWQSKRKQGKKKKTHSCINIHWNSFLIASFSFKHRAVRNFNLTAEV